MSNTYYGFGYDPKESENHFYVVVPKEATAEVEIYERFHWDIDEQKITSKELAIFSSRLNSKKFPLVIEWIDKQYLKPELLVSHYFKMEEIQNALHIFEHQPQSCCKIILNFD